ncbi:hypothetical protein [Mycetocola miduiensis]|uniref:hypothetical protein n=1 Tax=Mycetocola miduiensis TaxID=995034 RepID=UPI000B80F2E0|nr:hypothetical protein [Mycetocola miduiensis]
MGSPVLLDRVGIVEVALAVTAVLMDLFIPALVLLVLGACSLALRRQGPATLGVSTETRWQKWPHRLRF